jgi:hypothetical protein
MRSLPWYRPLPVPQPLEWVCAMDDLLTQRVRHCLLCGAYCPSTAMFGIWELSPRRCVAYAMHPACWQGGKATPAVRERLVQRYGAVVGPRHRTEEAGTG